MNTILKAGISLCTLLLSLATVAPAMAYDSGTSPDHELGCQYYSNALTSSSYVLDDSGIVATSSNTTAGYALWHDVEDGISWAGGLAAMYVPNGCKGMVLDSSTSAYETFAPGFYDLTGTSLASHASGTWCLCNDPRTAMSISFDGSNDYGKVPSGTWFSGTAFTISAWVYVDTVKNWSRIIDFGNGAPSENVLLAASIGTTGKPRFGIYKNGVENVVDSTVTIPTGVWTHIAATHDGSTTGKLYINGDLIATNTNMQAPASVTRTLNYIGRSNWSSDAYLDGKLTDVRVFTYAMTGSEVNELVSGVDYPTSSTGPAWSQESFRYRTTNSTTLVDMGRNRNDGTYSY